MNMSFSAFMKEATSEAKSWYERLKTSPVDENPIGGIITTEPLSSADSIAPLSMRRTSPQKR